MKTGEIMYKCPKCDRVISESAYLSSPFTGMCPICNMSITCFMAFKIDKGDKIETEECDGMYRCPWCGRTMSESQYTEQKDYNTVCACEHTYYYEYKKADEPISESDKIDLSADIEDAISAIIEKVMVNELEMAYRNGCSYGYEEGDADGYDEGYNDRKAEGRDSEKSYNNGYTVGFYSGYNMRSLID